MFTTSSEWSSKFISYAECNACFQHSRISFVVIIIAYPSFHSRKKINVFFYIFYDWRPQDIVLVSSNFATMLKKVRFYEIDPMQCPEISGIIFNIIDIRINR